MNMEKVIGGEEDTEGRRMVSIFNSIQFWYLAPETTILILQSHVWMYDCSVQYVIGTQTEKPLYHSLMWHKWCGGGRGYHLHVPHVRVVPIDTSPPTEKAVDNERLDW